MTFEHPPPDAGACRRRGSFTIPPTQPGAGSTITGLPPFCDVTLTQTNPPATDQVNIEVWLPLQGWNARFQGVGGGGYSCGISYSAMAPALQSGYATASTDCGHTPAQDNGSFALNANGAPGNGHCGGDSVGPVATDQFAALTNWVAARPPAVICA